MSMCSNRSLSLSWLHSAYIAKERDWEGLLDALTWTANTHVKAGEFEQLPPQVTWKNINDPT